MTSRLKSLLALVTALTLGCHSFAMGQTTPGTLPPNVQNGDALHESGSALSQPPAPDPSTQDSPASVTGTVVDQTGAVVAGAEIRLTVETAAQDKVGQDKSKQSRPTQDPAAHPSQNSSSSNETRSDTNGQFFFPKVVPGTFHLTVTSKGLEPQTASGILHPGEIYTVPPIALAVATAVTEVRVGGSQVEVAEEQIKEQEKQRVLGAIPNFYVSYIPDAAPLNAKQKFKLAGRTLIDPFTFVVVGGAAGVAQAQNHFAGYGRGAQGYAKRFGAGYADTVAATLIGSALLPVVLKQDPRYFYKGTGSTSSRFLYAIGNAVICKGDNGRWQANYSNVLGNLAAGGISNLYYPEQDRNGPGLTFENGAIGIGSTAIGNLFQEFLIRKLTPKLPKRDQEKP